MSVYHDDGQAVLYHGDCREVMATLETETFHAIVTDPPYELGFMGKGWDRSGIAYNVDVWREALRVAKPGAHLVAFGGTRTFHRLAVAIEDAGWEIRDTLAWMFGQGFPKSLDVSKAIDKAVGAERAEVGKGKGRTGVAAQPHGGSLHSDDNYQWPGEFSVTAPASDLARQWEGWGTALKPGYEPIVLARKPLQGTVAQNVTEHGAGALNIDGCRVEHSEEIKPKKAQDTYSKIYRQGGRYEATTELKPAGRWPANVVLDEEAAAMLDDAVGERVGFSGGGATSGPTGNQVYGRGWARSPEPQLYGDTGGPSRFFYTAKASRSEREQYLDGLEEVRRSDGRAKDIENPRLRTTRRRNHHPTVKPVDLMRWLVRLVTPPGAVVLDPFLGSGSTAIAAKAEGVRVVGIEMDREYIEIAIRRAAQMGFVL